MRQFTLFTFLSLFACAATAQERDLAVTIYNGDFGLVKDIRTIQLEKGTFLTSIDDVAAGIDATSVHLKALDHPDQVSLLEQNFKYDLASADRLLSRYLNGPVTVVLKEGDVAEGVLLSFDASNLVLGKESGAVVLSRAQVRDIRLGEVPGGLVVKPTLEWMLQSDREGRERMEVSYLTDDITWHAEYVAVANEKDTELDISGWVSIDNRSGAAYPNAKLKLVAGNVNRVRDRREMPIALAAEPYRGGAVRKPQFQSRELFEYHVYVLDRPATLADRETKQLTLFPASTAAVEKVLTYDGARDPDNVRVTLEFENAESNGLGMPLPAGKVRVFKRDKDGAMEFVGEDRVDHTPRDETIRVYLGDSFDVKGERKRIDTRKIADRVQEESYTIEIRNHKKQSARVVVVEHMRGREWRITKESHAHVRKDSHTLEYTLDLGAGESTTVTYTVQITF